MTRVVDYRRALPLPDHEQRNRWCAIVELQGGSAIGACHLRLPLTAGCERREADDVPPFADRCQRCHVVVTQHALLRSIDHSAAKACRPQPPDVVPVVVAPTIGHCHGNYRQATQCLGPSLCHCDCDGCRSTKERRVRVAARRDAGQHCQVEIGVCRGSSFCKCHCEGCYTASVADHNDAANLAAMRGLVVIGDMPSLVDHELDQLQRLAAPAMPRTTAVDLPYDVSDCGTPDIGDVDCVLCKAFGYSDHDGTPIDEAKS